MWKSTAVEGLVEQLVAPENAREWAKLVVQDIDQALIAPPRVSRTSTSSYLLPLNSSTPRTATMQTINLKITKKMNCGSCSGTVRATLEELDFVVSAWWA